MIRFAEKRDIPKLKSLWTDLYDDPKEYVDLYFENSFTEDKAVVYEKDNEIIGVMYLLPTKVCGNNTLYWYAGGIKNEFRKNGYFRELCEYILNYTKSNGFYNLCVPAENLFAFYRSLGLKHAFYKKELDFEKGECENVIISDLKVSDFENSELTVQWSDSKIKYGLHENLFCNGRNLKVMFKDKNYFFLYIKDYEKIVTLNISDDELKMIAPKILSNLGIEIARFEIIGNGKVPFALTDFESLTSDSTFIFTLT